MPDGDICRLHCNRCLHETKHAILKQVKRSGFEQFDADSSDGYRWKLMIEMLECCGCEEVSLRMESATDLEPERDIRTYSPRISRKPPVWRHQIPFEFRTLFTEIYQALHAESYTLAALGTRALIEQVLIDKIGQDQGGFARHLDEFEARGLITPEGRKILESAIEAGHAATHRGYKVKPEEIIIVLDIIENILLNIYVLPERSKTLSATIPARRSK